MLGVVAAAGWAPALCDSLAGADRILCSASTVIMCSDDGDCVMDSPTELNIPQFIEIDLKGKRLSTTRASGQNRSTPILAMSRDGGQIILQGNEKGRAFSFVISETTGMVSVAVARHGISVSVFGACTPSTSH
jgi:hypothetical protein